MDDTLPDADPAADPVEPFRELWKAGRPDVAGFVARAAGLRPDALTDLLRFDQQERWRAGEETPVEWYLDQFPQLAADPDGVQVLIYGEVLARAERGERPDLADFLLRFPRHAEFLRLQWEVHTALENAAVESTMTFEHPPAGGGLPAAAPVVPGYEIEGEVGRGAVGVVYKARQAAINRPCALKVVLEGQLARPDKLARFFEEGRAIARLKHPNIVGIYDLGTHATGPFMALEWVGGGTLADKIAGQPPAPAEAAGLAATLARAVGHAHQNGVIHRDLKPANVLVTEAGEPKIADFGLAKYLAADPALTPVGAVGPVGTPTYMSPEQTQGARDVTPAADVYSLGAILYELLTGRVPHAGATVPDTLRLVATSDPVPPRELNAAVPRDLEVICLKCLEKDPAARYPTGHELADDLGRFLAGEPIAARPVGPAMRAWRRLARNRRWAAAAVLAAATAALAAVGAVAGLVWLDAERRRAELAERAAVDRMIHLVNVRWRALLSEAQAIRRSGRPGQRTEALKKLREAKAVLDGLTAGKPAADDVTALRDEAVACLALYDVEPVDAVTGPTAMPPVVFFRGGAARGTLPELAAKSPDGMLGVAADGPDALRVWDLTARRPVFGAPLPIHKRPFGPDGRTLWYEAGGRDVGLRIVYPTGYTVRAVDWPITAERWDKATDLRGSGLTAAGVGYGAIQVNDVVTGKPYARLETPEPTRLRVRNFEWGGPMNWDLTAEGIDSKALHYWHLPTIRRELAKLGLDWDGP